MILADPAVDKNSSYLKVNMTKHERIKTGVIRGNIQESTADTVVVNLFEDVSNPGGATGAIDLGLEGAISEVIANGDLTGKSGEVVVLYPREALPANMP